MGVCIKEPLPRMLVLTLKRFEFDFDTMKRVKVNDRFEFPQTLDMSKHVRSTAVEETEAERLLEYYLFAVFCHAGTADGGHHFAFIKDMATSNWYCFNDASVTPATVKDIEDMFGDHKSSTNAYTLVYSSVDRIPSVRDDEIPDHVTKVVMLQ